MNTFDWLTILDPVETPEDRIVEISFNNGARKDFFINPKHSPAQSGDLVLVEVNGGGYDLGRITLSGELAKLQMKRKKVQAKSVLLKVVRLANDRDTERMMEFRGKQKGMLVKARAIAATLLLDMKIADIEFQADGKKAAFYYTSEVRVDFRELIRHYAKEFQVRVEMRHIGPRQETARLGGIGTCGRELCCSTWLSDFKLVNIGAARYQNLAINQAKLTGQCGKLKCCLNYELDTYLDALQDFPSKPEKIQTLAGTAELVKMDVFKGLLTYTYYNGTERGSFFTLDKHKVKELKELAKAGTPTESLRPFNLNVKEKKENEPDVDYEDVTGAVELSPDEKRRRKKKKKPGVKPPFDRGSSQRQTFEGEARSQTQKGPQPANRRPVTNNEPKQTFPGQRPLTPEEKEQRNQKQTFPGQRPLKPEEKEQRNQKQTFPGQRPLTPEEKEQRRLQQPKTDKAPQQFGAPNKNRPPKKKPGGPPNTKSDPPQE
jgi:cell fate regulator YaaT (PSP1 superfamily)